ncbi:hypothetical protein K2Y00_00720 [Patescibacteria group bacterium]|nr:hypothetical protein [Patescibacteria group bacterium]
MSDVNPEKLLPGHTPEPRHTLSGKLKNLYVWRAPDGVLMLREVLQDKDQTREVIEFNCSQWGYEVDQMAPRTTEERVQFGKDAFQKQLRVLEPALLEDGSVVFPYLENSETMTLFLRKASLEEATPRIQELFMDLANAHSQGIVYGDRWPDNILIDADKGVVHIDFDLKLGEFGKELEVAQLMLYTLALGVGENDTSSSRYEDLVHDLMARSPIKYDKVKVAHFLFTKIKMAPHYNHLQSIAERVVGRLGWSVASV